MNEVKIITAFTPPEQEPHISAEDDAAIYQGLVGIDGVLNVGKCLKCEVMSNNRVKILDGTFEINGHFARIPHGGYVEATITNGSANMNRHDIVVAVLRKNAVTGDKVTIEVKRGTPVNGEALDPELIQEDVYAGGKTREFALYRLILNGINIERAEPLFKRPLSLETTTGIIEKIIENMEEDLTKYFTLNLGSSVKPKLKHLHAHRTGKMVNIEFMAECGTYAYDNQYCLFSSTLPEQYRPSTVIYGFLTQSTGSLGKATTGVSRIEATDGSIWIATPTNTGHGQQEGPYYFIGGLTYEIRGDV